MVVKAIARNSIGRNGVGAFVFPCKKVTLQYCNWGGSSEGMRKFLTSKRLDKWGQEFPWIQFEVLRKSGHPLLRAEYTNGREKVVCVRNLNAVSYTHLYFQPIYRLMKNFGRVKFKYFSSIL